MKPVFADWLSCSECAATNVVVGCPVVVVGRWLGMCICLKQFRIPFFTLILLPHHHHHRPQVPFLLVHHHLSLLSRAAAMRRCRTPLPRTSSSSPSPCRDTLVRAYLGLVPTHRTQTGVKLPSKKTDTSSYHSTRKSCSTRVFLSEVRPFFTKPQPTFSGSAPRA
jgi:hypothetical protein